MFTLRCASVRAHTGRETSTHKKTWSIRITVPSKNVFVHVHARHSKLKRVQVKFNVAQRKFYAHTDLNKLE